MVKRNNSMQDVTASRSYPVTVIGVHSRVHPNYQITIIIMLASPLDSYISRYGDFCAHDDDDDNDTTDAHGVNIARII